MDFGSVKLIFIILSIFPISEIIDKRPFFNENIQFFLFYSIWYHNMLETDTAMALVLRKSRKIQESAFFSKIVNAQVLTVLEAKGMEYMALRC